MGNISSYPFRWRQWLGLWGCFFLMLPCLMYCIDPFKVSEFQGGLSTEVEIWQWNCSIVNRFWKSSCSAYSYQTLSCFFADVLASECCLARSWRRRCLVCQTLKAKLTQKDGKTQLLGECMYVLRMCICIQYTQYTHKELNTFLWKNTWNLHGSNASTLQISLAFLELIQEVRCHHCLVWESTTLGSSPLVRTGQNEELWMRVTLQFSIAIIFPLPTIFASQILNWGNPFFTLLDRCNRTTFSFATRLYYSFGEWLLVQAGTSARLCEMWGIRVEVTSRIQVRSSTHASALAGLGERHWDVDCIGSDGINWVDSNVWLQYVRCHIKKSIYIHWLSSTHSIPDCLDFSMGKCYGATPCYTHVINYHPLPEPWHRSESHHTTQVFQERKAMAQCSRPCGILARSRCKCEDIQCLRWSKELHWRPKKQ